MPRKRRASKHRAPVTAEAVEAFNSGDWIATHRALDLRPWEASPLDAVTAGPPIWAKETAYAETWPAARALRAEIQAR